MLLLVRPQFALSGEAFFAIGALEGSLPAVATRVHVQVLLGAEALVAARTVTREVVGVGQLKKGSSKKNCRYCHLESL